MTAIHMREGDVPLDEVVRRLRVISKIPEGKKNVWLGRNLEVIETTWFQRFVWAIFDTLAYYFDCSWFKGWFNIDPEETKAVLTQIKERFKDLTALKQDLERLGENVQNFSLFVCKTIEKYNELVRNEDRLNDFFERCVKNCGERGILNTGLCTNLNQVFTLLDNYPQLTCIYFSGRLSRAQVRLLLERVGREAHHIENVTFLGHCGLVDEDLKHLSNLRLQRFAIEEDYGTTLTLTGACLQQISSQNLKSVDLIGLQNRLTDDNLEVLREAELYSLRFMSTNVTARGLACLNLKELQSCDMRGREPQADVNELLQELSRQIQKPEEEAVLQDLRQRLENPKFDLKMDCLEVTEDTFAALRKCCFRSLSLENATPQALEALSDTTLRNLAWLHLEGGSVTLEDLKRLEQRKASVVDALKEQGETVTGDDSVVETTRVSCLKVPTITEKGPFYCENKYFTIAHY